MAITLSANRFFAAGSEVSIWPRSQYRADREPLSTLGFVGYDSEDETAGVLTVADDGTLDLTDIDSLLVEGAPYVAYQAQDAGATHRYIRFLAVGLG